MKTQRMASIIAKNVLYILSRAYLVYVRATTRYIKEGVILLNKPNTKEESASDHILSPGKTAKAPRRGSTNSTSWMVPFESNFLIANAAKSNRRPSLSGPTQNENANKSAIKTKHRSSLETQPVKQSFDPFDSIVNRANENPDVPVDSQGCPLTTDSCTAPKRLTKKKSSRRLVRSPSPRRRTTSTTIQDTPQSSKEQTRYASPNRTRRRSVTRSPSPRRRTTSASIQDTPQSSKEQMRYASPNRSRRRSMTRSTDEPKSPSKHSRRGSRTASGSPVRDSRVFSIEDGLLTTKKNEYNTSNELSGSLYDSTPRSNSRELRGHSFRGKVMEADPLGNQSERNVVLPDVFGDGKPVKQSHIEPATPTSRSLLASMKISGSARDLRRSQSRSKNFDEADFAAVSRQVEALASPVRSRRPQRESSDVFHSNAMRRQYETKPMAKWKERRFLRGDSSPALFADEQVAPITKPTISEGTSEREELCGAAKASIIRRSLVRSGSSPNMLGSDGLASLSTTLAVSGRMSFKRQASMLCNRTPDRRRLAF